MYRYNFKVYLHKIMSLQICVYVLICIYLQLCIYVYVLICIYLRYVYMYTFKVSKFISGLVM